MSQVTHIMLIAGEASGDHHAATLANQLRQWDPSIKLTGVGGRVMQQAGVTLLTDLTQYAVIGFFEVIKHSLSFYQAFRLVKHALRSSPPDLLILIDYPAFNLRLAKYAKSLGIKILYYISPQIWAWKSGRIKTIHQCVDHMAVILPFEENYYRQRGVDATYVGHPLINQVHTRMTKSAALEHFNLKPNRLTIGLLPGSRNNEIKYLWKILVTTARKCLQQWPDCQFVVPVASTLNLNKLKEFSSWEDLPITFTTTDKYEAMQCCDIALSCSGTVTLELALLGIPMIIFYRVVPLSYWIAKRIVHIRHIGLCNIVADQETNIVPELLQHDVNPDRLMIEVKRYVEDKTYYQTTQQALRQLREKLLQVAPQQTLLGVIIKLLQTPDSLLLEAQHFNV